MILDDIFSALDRPTASKIFFNLFGRDGILRQLQTTVILATHSSLSNIPNPRYATQHTDERCSRVPPLR